jgi:hypothetical protein
MRALICHQAQPRWKTLCMMKPQRVYLMQRMNSRGMSQASMCLGHMLACLCWSVQGGITSPDMVHWFHSATTYATSCTCKHVCGRSA